VEDGEGNLINNVIPKNEFRKRLALFYFENQSGDSSLNWLRYGLHYLVQYDINQDLYITNFGGSFDQLRKAGFKDFTGAPVSLLNQIARERHLSNYFRGSFTKEGQDFQIQTSLYDSRSGKLIAERSFTGDNIFTLADSISIALRHDLNIPAYHIRENEDLAISEILTNSLDAFRYFSEARIAEHLNDDYDKAIAYFQKAITIDSTFAMANLVLLNRYYLANRIEEAKKAVRAVMKHRYRLHEIYIYSARTQYHRIMGDWQTSFEVLKRWATLYPHYWFAQNWLAQAYEEHHQLDQAIELRQRILAYDPGSFNQLSRIGRLYERKGEMDKALHYFQLYADKFPNDFGTFIKIGRLYESIGDFKSAELNFKKAQLLEPESIEILETLAHLYIKLGNFDQSLDQLNRALMLAADPEDRATVYKSFLQYHKKRGQITKAFDYFEKCMSEMEKYNPEMILNREKTEMLELLVLKNRREEALQLANEIKQGMPLLDQPGFSSFSHLIIYTNAFGSIDLKVSRQKLDTLWNWIKEMKLNAFRGLAFQFEGKIAHAAKKYNKAIESYTDALEFYHGYSEQSISIYVDCARSYARLEESDKALEQLEQALKLDPMHPEAHYELALVYYKEDDVDQALAHLKKALTVWESADADYKPASLARNTLTEWKK
jgi:tetratricopeptide (TPR) repeat protein